MAYYEKVGLLVLNEDNTKFLVVEKKPGQNTTDYLIPGGRFVEHTIENCLKNEIKEEINCDVDFDSLEYVDVYKDKASGDENRDVLIILYKGKIIGEPKPSTEIGAVYWIGKEDVDNPKVSSIIRNKIIPGLIEQKILK